MVFWLPLYHTNGEGHGRLPVILAVIALLFAPFHKKRRKDAKQNYRPISILLILSKNYERSMFKQMYSVFKDIFSKHQFGFRKSLSKHHCLLTLLKKIEKCK